MSLRKLFLILFVLIAISWPSYSDAGRGCCSWHGGQSYCDTSVGRWVCNDGTYSPSCGCAYYPPKPVCPEATVGDNATWTFRETSSCTQDIDFRMDKGTNDEFYSIGISKTAGANPGPKADTTSTNYTFKDVKPGKWYINVKAGRSCGWGDISYWTVNVPQVKPTIYFSESIISEKERVLYYAVLCAQEAEINNGIGKLKALNGAITINPKENSLYTLTAYNKQISSVSSVSITYPFSESQITQSTAVSENIDEISDSENIDEISDSENLLWFWAYFIGVLWIIKKYFFDKIDD